MDQIVNKIIFGPPHFVQPPPPTPHSATATDNVFNHEFILKCINRQKANTNGEHDADDGTNHLHNVAIATTKEAQYHRKKRARINHTGREPSITRSSTGILRNISTHRRIHSQVLSPDLNDVADEAWLNVTTQNNASNNIAQDKWRRILAIPTDLSRDNRANHCTRINESWALRYSKQSTFTSNDAEKVFDCKKVQISLPQQHLYPATSSAGAHLPINISRYAGDNENNRNKRPTACSARTTLEKKPTTESLLTEMKANLRSRSDNKITRIATWNINNGFDHLAIASIMAKQDIDILAIQEPRISYSTKDDAWISTMRKELRKCKYELITSQFSYIIFDEQTSGAALASIIRQTSKINGRMLSVTFKTNDIWEAHTVISIYAVTNAKSTKKYANSQNSRKDVSNKLSKALDNELVYLHNTFGDAPITIVGDYQDTVFADKRDNIGTVGKKPYPNGPLQKLLNHDFQSAFHKLHPDKQQVTRWNGSRTAGRHIDLQMLNESAASLLISIKIDDFDTRRCITSDHLIVIADFRIEKAEQDIIDSYRAKINFRKIAGIKMKCTKSLSRCSTTFADIVNYNITFDDSQFMSCMVQDEEKMLKSWQHEATSHDMDEILTALEKSMLELEHDTATEDAQSNEFYNSSEAQVQRKLVERNSERRAHLDSIYSKFQGAIHKIASSLKIITSENKHVEALCTRQLMKSGKMKQYGDHIIKLTAPTAKMRSALGDLKHAEATLRILHHNTADKENKHIKLSNLNMQHCFQSLSKNSASFNNFVDACSHISRNQNESIEQENAISKYRHLDPYSGRWFECKFSSDICKSLLLQTNNILKENNVKQNVGMKQLDHSKTEDDHWSNIQHWWNGPDLTSLAGSSNTNIQDPIIAEAIQIALDNTRKLRKKAMAVLISNKEKMMLHESRLNHTRHISQRLNPKVMEDPEAHHVVLNPENIHAASNIRCSNLQECLKNTLLYHQNWMDRSGSKWEHHWFKTTSKFGHIDGINFNFAGKPTDADFENLVKQHHECSPSIRKAFQDAHSDEIASVMQPPRVPYRALDWIWHPSSTNADWKSFVENYWKAISSIPGKARYNGYTMAIIGRLPRRWIDLHFRLMRMMMILRILPEKTKVQARVPIPKPKPGETRPLSLIHDDMCFILGFLTKHFTLICEEINLFPPTLRAYRQGMSTSFITLIDLATREDALSFGRYMALTAEDEEKFFDRVSLEVQLAVLSILGFPMEGLLEIKAEEMDNISVEIHTRHGQVIGKFLHGLKQGSPLSVLVSNSVLVFKHRVWELRDPLAKIDDPNGYTMTTWNKPIDGDAPPLVSMEGFCDDNSKWNMGNGREFSSMVQAIKWNIKLAGDLSMIFKIGRRGDKTIIELFNVAPEDIPLLPENGFTSIAWDFKANRPTEEEVDCRVYLKCGAVLPSVQPASISDPVWNMLVKGTSLQSERSLGIWRNKLGDTSQSADKRAYLFGAKIDRLNLSSLKNDKTIKIAINSLVVPVYQFGILENKCCPQVYDKMDTVLINKVRQAIGFAWCDAKQLMFVSEDKFGMGIRSVSVEMLKSICRELEIQLNDEALLGKILRGRLQAFKDASLHHAKKASITTYEDINNGIRNLIMEAIRHAAHYGFYIRDMTEIKATYQIESAILLAQTGTLLKNFKHHTLGMHEFAGTGNRSGTTLGSGDTKLLWSSIYGRGHTLLNGDATHSKVKLNFSSDQLQNIKSAALNMLQDDIQALYSVSEWSDHNILQPHPGFISSTALTEIYQESINNTRHWHRISAITCMKFSSDDDIITETDNLSFLESLWILPRSVLLNKIESEYIQPNRLKVSDIECLLTNHWPLIVATDGGADTFETSGSHATQHRASASVVILHPPDIPFEQFTSASEAEQGTILSQNCFPWKARASSLPNKIGDHVTDNAHAECFAIILMEEWLPINIPVLLIMDSEAERGRYYQLRNMQHTTNRFMIRSLMAGVSKCLGSRLSCAIRKHQATATTPPYDSASGILGLCTHAKRWCYTTNGEESLWKLNQWDDGKLRTVWAVRSHQLESNFVISPKNRFGSRLVPNRFFVSANQWADNVCNAILRFKRNAIMSQNPSETRKWCSPHVSLGITGPNFIITCNGLCVDRCVSTAVEDACNQEFIRRYAQRPTQGLLLRLHNVLFIKPEMIGRQSYHRRFLEGKTKTHTRAMYTDLEYRKAIVYQYARTEGWLNDIGKLNQSLKDATKTYKMLRCPFCVSQIAENNDQHMFQCHAAEHSGLLGNTRHFYFYCLNQRVTAVRQQMTQILEEHLTVLLKLASNWGRLGFATLLKRVTNVLTELDRSQFHNAYSKELCYTKSNPSHYACFSSDDWIPFFESQSKQMENAGKNLFFQWPLVHQFGFITVNCYSLLEMQDGEYSPCDLLPLGVIPIVLQDTISKFASELGTRHSHEIRKEFLQQWQQVRAAALLRAISIAMVTGAQISDYKKLLMDHIPPSLFENAIGNKSMEPQLKDNPINPQPTRQKAIKVSEANPSDRFPCEGLTCSPIFTIKTNLRPSFMLRKGTTCRRCANMSKAITYAESIERTLAADLNTFRNFYSSINNLTDITTDNIIDIAVNIVPLPKEISPAHLKRATKRNVFSPVIMNMGRLLAGTFQWKMSTIPTSIDIVFNNNTTQIEVPMNKMRCACDNKKLFFAVNLHETCDFCDGISQFISVSQRITQTKSLSTQLKIKSQRPGRNSAKNHNHNRRIIQTADDSYHGHILRDITNTSTRSPLYMAARPPDVELNHIIQPNNMLSNFTVTYFFKIFAHKFQNILYQEFLFDLVKSNGSWKQFVQNSRRINHYSHLFEGLTHQHAICIIPICHHTHWTVLVRRFIGNSWKIFFIDSLTQDSERRFNEWRALFLDDTLFAGEWIKVKILQQTELECGARTCLHGVCFALSAKKSKDIIKDLSRFKDLAARSRLMVSQICIEGHWSYPKWLSRTIGNGAVAIG